MLTATDPADPPSQPPRTSVDDNSNQISMGLFKDHKRITDHLAALAFEIACCFIDPEDGYIEAQTVYELDEAGGISARWLKCVITARRLVVADLDASEVAWSLWYSEIDGEPRSKWWEIRSARKISSWRDLRAPELLRRIEIRAGPRVVELWGEAWFLREIRRAVAEAKTAPDGLAMPSRRQANLLVRVIEFLASE